MYHFFFSCPRCSQPTIFSKTWGGGRSEHGLRRPTCSARLVHLTGSHASILCRSWELIDCVPRYASLCRSDAGLVPSQGILLLRAIPAFRRANALGWGPNVTHRPRFLLHHQYPFPAIDTVGPVCWFEPFCVSTNPHVALFF